MMMAELFDFKDWQQNSSRQEYYRGNGSGGCTALRSSEIHRLIDDAVATGAFRTLV